MIDPVDCCIWVTQSFVVGALVGRVWKLEGSVRESRRGPAVGSVILPYWEGEMGGTCHPPHLPLVPLVPLVPVIVTVNCNLNGTLRLYSNVSNFPSSTNQHAIVHPARPLLPTSAIPIPSAHRAAINIVLVRLVLSVHFVHFVRLRHRAADHLRKRKEACTIPLSTSNHNWPPDLRARGKRNNEDDLVPTRRTEETTFNLGGAQPLVLCQSSLHPIQPRKIAQHIISH